MYDTRELVLKREGIQVMKRNLQLSVIVVVFNLMQISGCAFFISESGAQQEPAATPEKQHKSQVPFSMQRGSIIKTGSLSSIRVYLKSDVSPLPMNASHSWSIYVETMAGEPLKDALINVDGGVPATRHGFPKRPWIGENYRNGKYTINDVEFDERGRWVFIVSVIEGNVRDRVEFEVNL